MASSNRASWLKRVAATSIVLMGGAAGGLSARAFTELVEETERSVAESGGTQVLRMLARDGRPAVRAVVAELAATLWPERRDETFAVLRELARDETAQVRLASALGLARAIHHVPAVERVGIVCEWSLSTDVRDRAAVARALSWPTPVFVTDLVLEQLAHDESQEVRALALRAAGSHFHHNPALYRSLAERLSKDADEKVRREASVLLARV